MARYIAKNIVSAGLARKAESATGVRHWRGEPVSVMVDAFGTENIPEERITALVRENFSLTPKGIIEALDCRAEAEWRCRLVRRLMRTLDARAPTRARADSEPERTPCARAIVRIQVRSRSRQASEMAVGGGRLCKSSRRKSNASMMPFGVSEKFSRTSAVIRSSGISRAERVDHHGNRLRHANGVRQLHFRLARQSSGNNVFAMYRAM